MPSIAPTTPFLTRVFALMFLSSVTILSTRAAAAAGADDKPVSFSNDVSPILVARCQGCHGPDKVKGGYRLDSFERLKSPGSSGAAPFVAGQPGQSALHQLLVNPDPDDRMPKKGEPLPAAEVAVVRRWIVQGATFDGADASAPIVSLSNASHPAAPAVYPRPVPVTALAFGPDGKTLAAGGYHEVTLWDTQTGELRGRLGSLPRRITAVDFSPDGKLLAVAGGEPGTSGEVRIIDAAGGSTPPVVLDRVGEVMPTVRFSPDGRRLAAGGADNLIRVYDVATGRRERIIEQHADWVLSLIFSPDSKWLASASRDKSSRVFDASTGEMRGAFLEHLEPVVGVAWSVNGDRCYTAGRDRKLRAWRAEDGKTDGDGKKDSKGPKLSADPLGVAVSGDVVFVACADGVVRSFKGEKLEPAKEFGRFDEWTYVVAAHPKTNRVAAASFGGEVRVWSAEDGKEIAKFIAAPGYAPKPK